MRVGVVEVSGYSKGTGTATTQTVFVTATARAFPRRDLMPHLLKDRGIFPHGFKIITHNIPDNDRDETARSDIAI